mgnify:FL=1
MELRRQEPWVQADRIPPSVVAGNQTPSWAPPGAGRSEGFLLRGLGTAFIAVADDNHHHRIALLRALRATGHEVLHAAGPRSCESLIQESTQDIAALVCCAEMKEMYGFELARRVIQREPDIRILLVFRDSSDRQERDRASAHGYGHVLQSTSSRETCSQLARLLGSADPRDRSRHSTLVASRA